MYIYIYIFFFLENFKRWKKARKLFFIYAIHDLKSTECQIFINLACHIRMFLLIKHRGYRMAASYTSYLPSVTYDNISWHLLSTKHILKI